jgi:hypothetical protein
MAARLAEITRGLTPKQNPYLNTARAAILSQGLRRAESIPERMSIMPMLANEVLNAGRTQEAIDLIQPLLNPEPAIGKYAPRAADTRSFLGLCSMRLGTQDNCLEHAGAESCIVPVGPGGIYAVQRGPRSAIEQFSAVLRDRPDDLTARWLMNLAYMSLGEYPAKVPPRWLIPPEVFAPEYDLGRFVNVAPRAGVAFKGHAGGAVMEDFDGDGLLDIATSSMGLDDPLHVLHNNGDGTFADRTKEAGLEGELGGLNLVQADYDNDGHPDLLVLRGGWMREGGHFPVSLLRNNGDGTFEDVTEEAGLLSPRPTQTAGFADYDGDGYLDLFIGRESLPNDRNPSELYHNNGDGTFTERSADLGDPDLGYVKGVAWGDYDNDGRPDLYVSVLNGDNRLYHNDGRRDPPGPDGEDWRFTEVARRAGAVGPKDSFVAWFWDYDNDGWLDLFVGGYRVTEIGDVARLYLGLPTGTEVPRLYHNNRDGTFTDVAHAVRLDRVALVMGSNYGDLDNDGWPDLYLGTGEPRFSGLLPNRMFRNDRGRLFQDVTSSAGVGHIQKGHGVAFGDLDNDGDQDIFEEMGGWYEGDVTYSVLYRNPGHGNHWITLRLEGRRANRSAIGARLRVRVREQGGERDIHALVGGGGSFGGNSLQQEIGLGRAESIEAIEVRWPGSGATQTFRDVPMDRVYRVVEGEPRPEPVPVKSFSL